MLGVNPGYDSTVRLTPEFAIQKAMPFIRQRLEKTGYPEITVEPAAAVYNRAWGCPDGGEVGVVLRGTLKPEQTEQLEVEKDISMLMADLGQSTGTIEYASPVADFDSEFSYSSTYVQNEYEENAERSKNTLLKTTFTDNKSGIHFSIPLSGNMDEIGNLLQNQMETVGDGEYTVTGVLRKDDDTIYYEGTQNLVYAPDCNAYLDALNKVLETLNDYINGLPVIDASVLPDGADSFQDMQLLNEENEDFDPSDDL